MSGSSQRAEPELHDVRQAVISAAGACAGAVALLALHHASPDAVRVAEQAVTVLRDTVGALRVHTFDEAVIEAERNRAAEEALRAHGLPVPGPRRGHLHAV